MAIIPFINDEFLLSNKTAVLLYEQYAAGQPILDYHCHLPVAEIAANRRFNNLSEIWLEGDHYKWRAMRANGVPERFCTGDATPYDKFLAWARTVPYTLRNPLFHWTHLELSRYFQIEDLLSEESAPHIWNKANEILESGNLDVQPILNKFNVQKMGTTDDPTDSLRYHSIIAESSLMTRVHPTFRPDAALRVDSPHIFNTWVDKLSNASCILIDSLATLLEALELRVKDFHNAGSRLSDHGLDLCYAEPCTYEEASKIFQDARAGQASSSEDHRKYASHIMMHLGALYHDRDWTMQLHLGALRNVNSRAKHLHGPDTGFDSMGGTLQLVELAKFLDRLESTNCLPRTIIYNSNPMDNYAFATIAGSFSSSDSPGKVQFGSGWWFMDQKEGINWQLNALSNVGLLSRFVGMVTDSRSFMSYPRHEYFRRVLCDLLGSEIEQGLLPNDHGLIGGMVRDICYRNAERYLKLPVGPNPA